MIIIPTQRASIAEDRASPQPPFDPRPIPSGTDLNDQHPLLGVAKQYMLLGLGLEVPI